MSSLPKILVTGGHGQLASAIAKQADVLAPSKQILDITKIDIVRSYFDQHRPSVVINTAAYTAVDKAEQETEMALNVNFQGANHLSLICNELQIPLIHISTDYVFDGDKLNGYTEEDNTNPINHYGHSKLLGEEAIRNNHDQYFILRVSGIYSDIGLNFANTMRRLASENKLLRVINDQFTCPTHADDIAKTLLFLATQQRDWGTYHYCSAPAISWYEFARELLPGYEQLSAIPSTEYKTAAKRPANSVLNCDKIKRVFGITQPNRK